MGYLRNAVSVSFRIKTNASTISVRDGTKIFVERPDPDGNLVQSNDPREQPVARRRCLADVEAGEDEKLHCLLRIREAGFRLSMHPASGRPLRWQAATAARPPSPLEIRAEPKIGMDVGGVIVQMQEGLAVAVKYAARTLPQPFELAELYE